MESFKISQAENNKIEALQNVCIRILSNGRLWKLTTSIYKTINSIRFEEMVKLA